jgi:quaternary ammonium compound-resistance protein SugE
MAWVYLFSAGLLEIVWAYFMKQSLGFIKITPSIIMLIAMGFSFILLALAMKTLPLSTAYALWTGIGVVGTFIVGIVFLGEPINTIRIVASLLVLSGLILMKLSG